MMDNIIFLPQAYCPSSHCIKYNLRGEHNIYGTAGYVVLILPWAFELLGWYHNFGIPSDTPDLRLHS